MSMPQAPPTIIDTDQVNRIIQKIRPFVMPPVAAEALTSVVELVQAVLTLGVPGDFVQCGVWRGGTAFLMAELLRQAGVRDRRVWLFDSFEGMPPVQEIDGPVAMAHANDPNNPLHVNNSRVSVEEVQRSAEELGLGSYVTIVKGWFDDTLPAHRARVGAIALLHVDCDWYASVRCCLENLYDQVSDGGFVFLDDYPYYDGCTIAVHEFLAARRLPHGIESVIGDWGGCEYYYAAHFRKGPANWRWDCRRVLAARDLAASIPDAARFVFIDDGQFIDTLGASRGAMPLYMPADVAAVIPAIDELRRAGARFLVVAWPSFWWFDYCVGLRSYLDSAYQCVRENNRVVIFALEPRHAATAL